MIIIKVVVQHAVHLGGLGGGGLSGGVQRVLGT